MPDRTLDALIRHQITRFLTEAHAEGKDISSHIDEAVDEYRAEEYKLALIVTYMNHRFGLPSSSRDEYAEHRRVSLETLCSESGDIDGRRAADAFAAIGVRFSQVDRAVQQSIAPAVASWRSTWQEVARECGFLPAVHDRGIA